MRRGADTAERRRDTPGAGLCTMGGPAGMGENETTARATLIRRGGTCLRPRFDGPSGDTLMAEKEKKKWAKLTCYINVHSGKEDGENTLSDG